MYQEREIELRDHRPVTVAFELDTLIEEHTLFVAWWSFTVVTKEDGENMNEDELSDFAASLTELDNEFICDKIIELHLKGN